MSVTIDQLFCNHCDQEIIRGQEVVCYRCEETVTHYDFGCWASSDYEYDEWNNRWYCHSCVAVIEKERWDV